MKRIKNSQFFKNEKVAAFWIRNALASLSVSIILPLIINIESIWTRMGIGAAAALLAALLFETLRMVLKKLNPQKER